MCVAYRVCHAKDVVRHLILAKVLFQLRKNVIAEWEELGAELVDAFFHLIGLHAFGLCCVDRFENSHAVQSKLLKLVQGDLILRNLPPMPCSVKTGGTARRWPQQVAKRAHLRRLIVDADLDALLGCRDGTPVQTPLVDASKRCHGREAGGGRAPFRAKHPVFF